MIWLLISNRIGTVLKKSLDSKLKLNWNCLMSNAIKKIAIGRTNFIQKIDNLIILGNLTTWSPKFKFQNQMPKMINNHQEPLLSKPKEYQMINNLTVSKLKILNQYHQNYKIRTLQNYSSTKDLAPTKTIQLKLINFWSRKISKINHKALIKKLKLTVKTSRFIKSKKNKINIKTNNQINWSCS